MIVRWPGKVKTGTHSNAICQYEDITPTLIAAAGGKPIEGLDGKSFLPVLLGKKNSHREYAFGIHNNTPEGPPYPIRSIRSEKYKLILNLDPSLRYHNKFMMDTAKLKGYWLSWLKEAQHSQLAKQRTDRIMTRPAVEFYDLEKDPFELNNLAADKALASVRERMQTRLTTWMQERGDAGAETDRVYR